MTADDAVRGRRTSEAAPSDELVTFHVKGLPIAVQARAQEHADGLTRELTLVGAALRQGGNTRQLPSRLVDLIEQLSAQYSMLTVEQEQQIADAIAAGARHDRPHLPAARLGRCGRAGTGRHPRRSRRLLPRRPAPADAGHTRRPGGIPALVPVPVHRTGRRAAPGHLGRPPAPARDLTDREAHP